MTTNVCIACQNDFTVTKGDLGFYHKISPIFNGRTYQIPPPTRCPACRTQRRFLFRNERNLYPTTSGLSGAAIISNIHPDAPWKVYDRDEWYSDTWQATDFGQPFDYSKTFTEQFLALQRDVPILNLNTVNNVNCSYCNYVASSKDSYLIFGSVYAEDCYYGNPYYSRSCVDSLLVRDSELCYDCVTCEQCYGCLYCQDCVNSRDLILCYDVQGSSDCIGCVGLRGKQYCVFNEQLSEHEYRTVRDALDFCNAGQMAELRERFVKLQEVTPHRFAVQVNAEGCTGNYIYNSKNTYDSYDVQRCEDSRYLAQTIDQKDCYDCNFTEENELCYEYLANYRNQRCLFSFSNHTCSDTLYSTFCMASRYLFGCIGVKQQQYYILNQPYSEEEYNQLVPKIIEHMRETGEWGEFLDPSLSYFAYNETVAQEYFPQTKDEATAQGYTWRDPDPKEYGAIAYTPPAAIAEVTEDILQQTLGCSDCRKRFKLIGPELAFYKQHQLPIPARCPNCRHTARLALRTPRTLVDRTCTKCGKELKTTYDTARPEPIYCEQCFQQAIY